MSVPAQDIANSDLKSSAICFAATVTVLSMLVGVAWFIGPVGCFRALFGGFGLAFGLVVVRQFRDDPIGAGIIFMLFAGYCWALYSWGWSAISHLAS